MRKPLSWPFAELFVNVESWFFAQVQTRFGRCERKVFESFELAKHEFSGSTVIHFVEWIRVWRPMWRWHPARCRCRITGMTVRWVHLIRRWHCVMWRRYVDGDPWIWCHSFDYWRWYLRWSCCLLISRHSDDTFEACWYVLRAYTIWTILVKALNALCPFVSIWNDSLRSVQKFLFFFFSRRYIYIGACYHICTQKTYLYKQLIAAINSLQYFLV